MIREAIEQLVIGRSLGMAEASGVMREVMDGETAEEMAGMAEGASGVFGNGQEQKAKNDASLVARLYQEIGQLKVEKDFLAERSGP